MRYVNERGIEGLMEPYFNISWNSDTAQVHLYLHYANLPCHLWEIGVKVIWGQSLTPHGLMLVRPDSGI